MSSKHKEWMSKIAAAQRLGISQKEVEKLIQEDQLEHKTEYGKVSVSKESVYAYSSLHEGNQKKKSGRKPRVLSIEEACEMLDISITTAQRLVESGKLEAYGDGVTERSVKSYKHASLSKPKTAKKVRLDKPTMRTAKADQVPGAITLNEEKDVNKKTEEKDTKNENTKEKQADDASAAATPETNTEANGKTEEVKSDIHEDSKDRKSTSSDKNGEDKDIGFNLEAVMKEFFPGMRLLSTEIREEMLKQCDSNKAKYSEKEVKEVTEIAFMRGKLSVYESMDEFKRRGVKE